LEAAYGEFLVGGDVHDAADPAADAFGHQPVRSHHITFEEWRRIVDRPVDVRFGREVHHHVVARHHIAQERHVGDVAPDEAQPRMSGGQIPAITGVREFVQHCDGAVFEAEVASVQ
jgi:hypothetical protein